jgi:receptor-type tyrosine-protein phosphatase beta
MQGFSLQREYIATQGPLPSTLEDFWRMVWEQHVNVIVMLTRVEEKGQKKCESYWPADEQPVYYGDLQLQLESVEKIDTYTLRLLSISLVSSVLCVRLCVVA